MADRRRVAVAGTRQGCTARLPSCEAYLFWILHSCAPLASPHTSTRWTPQGSSLARDRQECVIGPITPSIKGPFRPGPSASPDRAPFLEPGSNHADRPRGPPEVQWLHVVFSLLSILRSALPQSLPLRLLAMCAPGGPDPGLSGKRKQQDRYLRQTGAGGRRNRFHPLSRAIFFSRVACHGGRFRASGSMTLCCCHWKGVGRGETCPRQIPFLLTGGKNSCDGEATPHALHGMPVSWPSLGTGPDGPVATVLIPCLLGADSVPRPERIQHRKFQDAGHGSPHFKAALGHVSE